MSNWDEWFDRRRRMLPFDWAFQGFPFFNRSIDDIMDEMKRKMEEMLKSSNEKLSGDIIREKRMPDGSVIREIGPIIYGYSMTIGPEGKPEIREFGNVRPRTKRLRAGEPPVLDITDTREPLVDVMSTNGEIKVTAELPGVEKEDINLNVTETTLRISVNKPGRRFHKQLELPTEVDVEKAKSTYKNGVLEVTLQKKKTSPPKGVAVRIE